MTDTRTSLQAPRSGRNSGLPVHSATSVESKEFRTVDTGEAAGTKDGSQAAQELKTYRIKKRARKRIKLKIGATGSSIPRNSTGSRAAPMPINATASKQGASSNDLGNGEYGIVISTSNNKAMQASRTEPAFNMAEKLVSG